MKFNKIECDGKFLLEFPSPSPTWTADDEGRLWYSSSVERMYLGGSPVGSAKWLEVLHSESQLDADNMTTGTLLSSVLPNPANIDITGTARYG